LDFEFFLNLNIEKRKYKKENIDLIFKSYSQCLEQIKEKAKENKKQFNLYSEGQVRKMFNGGLLPALFELDDTRDYEIIDFSSIGENWAYFNFWQKYQKKKINQNKIWNIIIKTGSILAIALTIIKLLEYLN